MTLEKYKFHLIDHHRVAYDDTPEKRKERKSILERNYSDEFLAKVIDDTEEFALDLFGMESVQIGYCKIPLEDDTEEYISLNLVGGYSSDRLITDPKGRVVSSYLLRRIFGEALTFRVICDEVPVQTEWEDLMSIDHYYYIYMQGFPKNLEEIKAQLQSQKQKIKD